MTMDLAKARSYARPMIGGAATVGDLERAVTALRMSIKNGGSPAYIADYKSELASVEGQLASRRKARRNGSVPRKVQLEGMA